MAPLLEALLAHVPPPPSANLQGECAVLLASGRHLAGGSSPASPCAAPSGAADRPACTALGTTADPFSFLVVMTERHSFLGKIVTGRVHSGTVALGDRVKVLWRDGERRGLQRSALFAAVGAGDGGASLRCFTQACCGAARQRRLRGFWV